MIKEYSLIPKFIEFTKSINNPVVLELGTKQSILGRSTLHKELVPHYKSYYGTDLDNGNDVDFACDLHTISKDIHNFNVPSSYDIIISCSTYEHLLNPFTVSKELYNITNKGGIIFIQTHNCFPIHAYPYDFWRYTIESLSAVLTQAGYDIIDCAYEYPAYIHSKQDENTKNHISYLNVSAIGIKL